MSSLEEMLAMLGTQPLSGGVVRLPNTAIPVLERRHPLNKANQEMWAEIQDVVFDGVNDHKEKYIPKGRQEDPADYENRLGFARFKGEMKPLIGRLVGAIFKRPVTRPDALMSNFGDFVDDVDGSDTTLSRFMEDRCKEVLAFGAAPILVDRPETVEVEDENGNVSTMVAEKTYRGFVEVEEFRVLGDQEFTLTPYFIHQLFDWSTDAQGEPHWIKLAEVIRRATPFGGEMRVTVYRMFDRMSWRTFEVREQPNKNGDLEKAAYLVGQGDHHVGMVPIAIPYYEKSGTMDFTSPFVNAYHFDIEEFRNDADLQWDTFIHAHPTLKDGRSSQKKDRITVGPGSSVEVDTQSDEDVAYLEFPATATEELRKNKEEAVSGRRRVAGIDTLSGSQDPQANAASGRSRVVSFSISEERVMSRGATGCEKGENRIFELVTRWNSDQEDAHHTESLNEHAVQYPKKFGLDDLSEGIGNWKEIRSDVNSERLDRELQKKIADQALGDVSAEVRKEVMDDIENNPILKPSAGPLGSALEEPDLEQRATAEDAEEAFSNADKLEPMTVADLEAAAR